MTRRLTLTLGLVAVMAHLGAGAATAQNLLTNPNFTSDLPPWTVSPDTSHDNAVGGSSGPGSARWEITLDSESESEAVLIMFQCVSPVVVGATYDFGGQVRTDEAAAGGAAHIVLVWHPDNGCSDPPVGAHVSSPVTGPTVGFTDISESGVAPIGAASVSFFLLAGAEPLDPGFAVDVDALEGALVPEPGDYLLFADDMFLRQITAVPTTSLPWLIVLASLVLGTGAASVMRRRATHTASV